MLPLHTFNWPLGVAAATLVGLWLIASAYRAGRRSGGQSRSERLDRLTSAFHLHGTTWNVSYIEHGRGGPCARHATVSFRQHDARVLAEGRDNAGANWTAEGIAHADKLCLTLVETDAATHRLGAVIVDCTDATGAMLGLRCIWSCAEAASVQAIRFEPTDDVDRGAPPAEMSDSGNAR
jgi:hypothetical protein